MNRPIKVSYAVVFFYSCLYCNMYKDYRVLTTWHFTCFTDILSIKFTLSYKLCLKFYTFYNSPNEGPKVPESAQLKARLKSALFILWTRGHQAQCCGNYMVTLAQIIQDWNLF